MPPAASNRADIGRDMSSPVQSKKTTRTRTSESALRIAMKVMQDQGLTISKLIVTGGQVEIVCGIPGEDTAAERDDGLKSWDDWKPERSKKSKRKDEPEDW